MPRPRRPFGPYATADGRLTAEGQSFVQNWLDRWPNPALTILRKEYPQLWSIAEYRLGSEAVNAACEAAAVYATQTFQRNADAAFFCYWRTAMRFEVKELLRVAKVLDRDGRVVSVGDPRRPESLTSASDTVIRREPVGVGVSVEDVEAALSKVRVSITRNILRRHLLGGECGAAIGRECGMSRQRVHQIVTAGKDQIRQELQGMK